MNGERLSAFRTKCSDSKTKKIYVYVMCIRCANKSTLIPISIPILYFHNFINKFKQQYFFTFDPIHMINTTRSLLFLILAEYTTHLKSL